MRALVYRKLNALGYSIGKNLKLRGLEAIGLKNQHGDALILVSSVFYGPSWVQIYKSLENQVPPPTLLSLGKTPSVIIQDTEKAQEILASLYVNASSSRRKQVHLDGVGFVELDSRAKPDPKILILPLVSIVCVVALGLFWGGDRKTSEKLTTTLTPNECIVDANSSEFDAWLSDSLGTFSEPSPGEEIQKSTPKGQLQIVVDGLIGSAAKVSGAAVCTDGRQREINHRIDISGTGAVLELGQ
jgi:hypothetical protein